MIKETYILGKTIQEKQTSLYSSLFKVIDTLTDCFGFGVYK